MGFFDKLFGGKTEQEETVKFFGQSKTVLTPIRGKVLAQADIRRDLCTGHPWPRLRHRAHRQDRVCSV